MRDGTAERINDKTQFDSWNFVYEGQPRPQYGPRTREFQERMKQYEKSKRDNKTLNILGISTTMMMKTAEKRPEHRPSTSERALERALAWAKKQAEEGAYGAGVKCEPVMVKLRDLDFRFCEGYYSKDKVECQWPCVISGEKWDGDQKDKMDVIYWGLAHWADIVFVATPIRYGNAGALYYKMIERLNSIHNEMTLRDHHVIKDKAAAFIITGGQDGVQAVAGQMLTFWSELGFLFSRYSYVGWNRGWYAENTKKNFGTMSRNKDFERDLKKMVDYAVDIKLRLNSSSSVLTYDYEDETINPLIKLADPDPTDSEISEPESELFKTATPPEAARP